MVLIGLRLRFSTPSLLITLLGLPRGISHWKWGGKRRQYFLHKYSPHRWRTAPLILMKDPDRIPPVALCPCCHLPINPRQCYEIPVIFCMPAGIPPPPPATRANLTTNQRCNGEGNPSSFPSPAQPENNRPSPPLEPPGSGRPLSPERPHCSGSISRSSPARVASSAASTHGKGKGRRSSTGSVDYLEEFDRLSIIPELVTALRENEGHYFPQDETHTSASTSPPSTESSLVPSTSGGPLPGGRRWVVFQGRVPGVYVSS